MINFHKKYLLKIQNKLALSDYAYLWLSFLKGVGPKLTKYLKNKRIEKINDLLWHFPYSSTDRSNMTTLDKLEVGKIQTIKEDFKFLRDNNLNN